MNGYKSKESAFSVLFLRKGNTENCHQWLAIGRLRNLGGSWVAIGVSTFHPVLFCTVGISLLCLYFFLYGWDFLVDGMMGGLTSYLYISYFLVTKL